MWTSSGSSALPQPTYITGQTTYYYGNTVICSNTTVYGSAAVNVYPSSASPMPIMTTEEFEEEAGIEAVLDENEKLVIQIAELEKEIATLLGLDEA